jgi:hypothetical protein
VLGSAGKWRVRTLCVSTQMSHLQIKTFPYIVFCSVRYPPGQFIYIYIYIYIYISVYLHVA